MLETTGNWVSNDSYSKSSNSRKCMSIVKGKLLGRGVLVTIEVEATTGQKRPKKVRVNDEGRPTGQRSPNQSIVFGWVWEKAEEVLGSFAGDTGLASTASGGYNDLPF